MRNRAGARHDSSADPAQPARGAALLLLRYAMPSVASHSVTLSRVARRAGPGPVEDRSGRVPCKLHNR